jgi:hypothetical protein
MFMVCSVLNGVNVLIISGFNLGKCFEINKKTALFPVKNIQYNKAVSEKV